jgi:hypothetical protein
MSPLGKSKDMKSEFSYVNSIASLSNIIGVPLTYVDRFNYANLIGVTESPSLSVKQIFKRGITC